MKTNELSPITKAYLECALWSSTNDEGEPLDNDYDLDDFAPEALAQAERECLAFASEQSEQITLAEIDDKRVGHNLWLNRNGHGSGFWDEYYGTDSVRYAACRKLADVCRHLGTSDCYTGDDGKVYLT